MNITVIWTVIIAVNYYSNIKENLFFREKSVITAVNYFLITAVANEEMGQ